MDDLKYCNPACDPELGGYPDSGCFKLCGRHKDLSKNIAPASPLKLSDLLTQTSYAEQVEALGYSREVLHRLAKRGAIVIDGVVYAPVTKRKSRS